ncbi:hypothetical protein [Streptomyces sp. NPDC002540]
MHRWYAGYETDNRNLDHQGELVTEDFTLRRPPEGGLPDVQGRQAYLDGLATLYPGKSNAHHLRSIAIEHNGPDTAQATVTHDFETAGPSLNGAALLRYDLKLVQHPAGLRADWRLADGTFVEALGLMAKEAYAAKVARKRELARNHGLRLVTVTAEDLGRLPEVFADWLPEDSAG